MIYIVLAVMAIGFLFLGIGIGLLINSKIKLSKCEMFNIEGNKTQNVVSTASLITGALVLLIGAALSIILATI